MDGKDFEKTIAPYPELVNANITVFIDHPPKTYDQLKENPTNIFITLEPNQLFGIHDWVLQNHNLFNGILTWNENILNTCDNAYFFAFGVSWLDKEYVKNADKIEKLFDVSFLCGAKKMIEGHFLRHRLFDRGNEISIPKKWFYTLDDYKLVDGHHSISHSGICQGEEKKKLWNSMFSICIENSSNFGYQTEKIIDAFLTKTIPIYWGCTNIGDYYNIDGIIHCKDENEIINKVNQLTPEYYYSRKGIIEENYIKAQFYGDIFSRFVNIMKEIIKYNDV